mgnify:CR=1 FL=1
MTTNKKIGIIGSGFSGLAAASVLAKENHSVHVFEKNDQIGGRARKFSAEGFTFDMGPSWYWMPDVIEKFYNKFNHTTSDFYELIKLDPGFKVIFKDADAVSIPAKWEELCQLFEDIETGAADKLRKFMSGAEYKYNIGVNDLVYQPGLSILEVLRMDLVMGVFKLDVFSSFRTHVRKYFKDPRLVAIMEFPVLFLGAMPKDTPALYSLMNFAGMKQGTFYPMGGFSKIPEAMKKIALEQGVEFHLNHDVKEIVLDHNRATHLRFDHKNESVDSIIASADYHHVEQVLLPESHRNYNEKYWNNRVFAPSSLLFYLGVDKKVPNLDHHNLFFDEDLDQHAEELYVNKSWPSKPLFYVCCPSKTDESVAPEGKENVFLLMPLAPGLEDGEALRETYFDIMMDRLEAYTKSDIRAHISYKRSYCISDFESDYNAYKGNAYGLANTLLQTANLKPKIKNNKIDNLYYTGQLTVPGPGVPPSIISGQVAADQLLKSIKKSK